MKKRIFWLSIFCLAFSALTVINPVDAQSETVYVFANRNVADNTLSKADIQNIYLGKKDKWENNQGINFTALSEGKCYESFIREFVGRTTFQFQNYWKKQIFTGKGQPPRGFDSHGELVDYVSRTPGAIGFSCTTPDSTKVKILTITR